MGRIGRGSLLKRSRQQGSVNTYSIKDLERLSGIKAHTLRVWEQRYKVLTPKRSDTNIRYYTDEDLKHLLNISLLNKSGYKISRIAKMEEEDLRQKVLDLNDSETVYSVQVDALVIAMIDLSERAFEKVISTSILRNGLEETILYVVYPFLQKVGILWQTSHINPAQEHFVSNLIRQKLLVAIDGQYTEPPPGAPKYLLFLPQGEYHELALLFASYIIRSYNRVVIYLGQHVPVADVKEVFRHYKPEFLLTMITTAEPEDLELDDYIQLLSQTFPETEIFFSGSRCKQQGVPDLSNTHLLPQPVCLKQHLDSGQLEFNENR